MGADQNMYSGSWRSLPNATFLDWPPHRGEQSITEIAARIQKENQIGQRSIIVGSSLGGIVACEIANQLPIDGIILIGSARHKSEISALLSVLHSLINLTPLKFLQQAAGKLPNELMQMFSHADPDFIRSTCQSIFEWKGLNRASASPLRIHGAKDRVIPLPNGVQHVLDGGHLLAMTHEEECVTIVKEFLAATAK
jgi:pimeloyl-ACP methyl ester carboxylesterase